MKRLLPVLFVVLPACNQERAKPVDKPAASASTSSAVAAPTPSQPIKKVEVSFEEKLLATIPEGVTTRRLSFDGFGQQVAYLIEREDSYLVVQGDKQSEPFDSIYSFEWSPSGTRLAYEAKQQGKYLFVVDGKKSALYSSASPWLSWSPDSAHIAYNADGGLFIGDKRIAPEGPIMSFYWGPNSSLVYAVKQGDKQQALVIDGKVSESFYYMLEPAWSPDGAHLAYVVSSDEKMFLVVDGKRTEQPQSEDLRWSPDSKKLAYWFSRDSGDLSPNKAVMVIDGKEGEPFDKVSAPSWSPDSAQLAYAAQQGGKFKIYGDKESAAFDELSVPSWSPDSKQIAYVAKKGKTESVIAGDKTGEAFDEVYPDTLSWSPDSMKVAYAARKGDKIFVIAGDKMSEPLDFAGRLRWSKDSARVAYGARLGSELRWKVLAL